MSEGKVCQDLDTDLNLKRDLTGSLARIWRMTSSGKRGSLGLPIVRSTEKRGIEW